MTTHGQKMQSKLSTDISKAFVIHSLIATRLSLLRYNYKPKAGFEHPEQPAKEKHNWSSDVVQ